MTCTRDPRHGPAIWVGRLFFAEELKHVVVTPRLEAGFCRDCGDRLVEFVNLYGFVPPRMGAARAPVAADRDTSAAGAGATPSSAVDQTPTDDSTPTTGSFSSR